MAETHSNQDGKLYIYIYIYIIAADILWTGYSGQ